MQKSAFILAPTSMATQLSALTGRPVVNKGVPAVSANGRVIDSAAAKRRALLAAVDRFNDDN